MCIAPRRRVRALAERAPLEVAHPMMIFPASKLGGNVRCQCDRREAEGPMKLDPSTRTQVPVLFCESGVSFIRDRMQSSLLAWQTHTQLTVVPIMHS